MRALVTGGAASGKSAFAERLAQALAYRRAGEGAPARLVYAATMDACTPGAESRIARHRALRAGKGFHLVECPNANTRFALLAFDVVLVEDVGNLVANEMFPRSGVVQDAFAVCTRVSAALERLARACRDIVVVTNEVGSDGARYDAATESYRRTLGSVSCAFAETAAIVCECVAGMPNVAKGADALSSVFAPAPADASHAPCAVEERWLRP